MPALKGLKRSAAPSTRHSGHSHLLYYRRSRLPFAQRPQTLRDTFDQALRPQPSAILSAFEAAVCPKASNAPRHLRPGTQATAICFYRCRRCRLSPSKAYKPSAAASTRHSGHSHLRLAAFEAAVCPPSKA